MQAPESGGLVCAVSRLFPIARLYMLASCAAGFAALAGCNIGEGFSDLGGDLLLPDAALLDRPGRRLAQGSYGSLTVDGSLEDGGRVLALKYQDEETGLAIVPFLDGEACEIFPALSFERVSSRIDIDLAAIVAVQTTTDDRGRGTIRFVDFSCQDVLPAMDEAQLPRVPFPEDSPRGLLMLGSSNDLYFIDAKAKTQQKVAEKVQIAHVAENQLWTVEEGVLIARDEDFKETARVGTAVESFVVDAGDDDVVFLEGGVLFGLSRGKGDEKTLRKIAEDACEPSAAGPNVLSYFSPCAERRLMLEVHGEAVGLSVPRVTIVGPRRHLPRETPQYF